VRSQRYLGRWRGFAVGGIRITAVVVDPVPLPIVAVPARGRRFVRADSGIKTRSTDPSWFIAQRGAAAQGGRRFIACAGPLGCCSARVKNTRPATTRTLTKVRHIKLTGAISELSVKRTTRETRLMVGSWGAVRQHAGAGRAIVHRNGAGRRKVPIDSPGSGAGRDLSTGRKMGDGGSGLVFSSSPKHGRRETSAMAAHFLGSSPCIRQPQSSYSSKRDAVRRGSVSNRGTAR
jgi:hypothetical protein